MLVAYSSRKAFAHNHLSCLIQYGLFQDTRGRLGVVQGRVVYIACLYLVYDIILHLLGEQWQHCADFEFTIRNEEWEEIPGKYLQRESHSRFSQRIITLVILNRSTEQVPQIASMTCKLQDIYSDMSKFTEYCR